MSQEKFFPGQQSNDIRFAAPQESPQLLVDQARISGGLMTTITSEGIQISCGLVDPQAATKGEIKETSMLHPYKDTPYALIAEPLFSLGFILGPSIDEIQGTQLAIRINNQPVFLRENLDHGNTYYEEVLLDPVAVYLNSHDHPENVDFTKSMPLAVSDIFLATAQGEVRKVPLTYKPGKPYQQVDVVSLKNAPEEPFAITGALRFQIRVHGLN